MVQHTEDAAVQRYQRNHQHLKRNHHGGDHQPKQYPAGFPFITNDHKGRHGGKQDSQNSSRNRNNQRVPERSPKAHFFHGIGKILQGKSLTSDEYQRISHDIALLFKNVDHYHDKREDKCQEYKDQHHHHNGMSDSFFP